MALKTAAECLKRAEACEQAASACERQATREIMLYMAERWRAMANADNNAAPARVVDRQPPAGEAGPTHPFE